MADPVSIPVGDILANQTAGMSAAAAAAIGYGDAIARAAARSRALSEAMAGPGFARASAYLQQQADAGQRLTLQARNQQFAAGAASGAVQKQAAAVQQLNRQYDAMQAKARLQAQAADLASGAYARNARALADVRREQQALDQQARVTDLVAERGRFGAFKELARPHAQRLGGVTQQGVGFGLGLMRQGLSGTVEGFQLDRAWQRLARQVAAVAIPAIEMMSRGVNRVAGWFEKLSGKNQELLLQVGLVAVGFGMVSRVFGLVTTAGGALVGLLRAAGMVGAAGAAAGGAAAGGGLLAAGAPAALAAAGGGGAAAKLLMGGGLAAGGVAAGATGFGTEALAAGGLLGATAGVMGRTAGSSALKAGARGALRFAAPVAAGLSAYEGYETYRDRRGRGESRLEAGAKAVAHGAVDFASFGMLSLYDRDKKATDGAEKKRRDVTPLHVGELEAGGSAGLIQEEVLKAIVAREEERKAAEEAATEATKGATSALEDFGAMLRDASDSVTDFVDDIASGPARPTSGGIRDAMRTAMGLPL